MRLIHVHTFPGGLGFIKGILPAVRHAHDFINQNLFLRTPFSAFVCRHTFSMEPTHCL